MSMLRLRKHPAHFLRVLLAWCMLVALPVQALSGTLTQLLGTAHIHRHADTPDPMTGWQDFRRVSHLREGAGRAHAHDSVGRHRHARDAVDVVPLGNDDNADGAAASGSTANAAAASVGLPVARPLPLAAPLASRAARWAAYVVGSHQDCDPRRLDKPPMA